MYEANSLLVNKQVSESKRIRNLGQHRKKTDVAEKHVTLCYTPLAFNLIPDTYTFMTMLLSRVTIAQGEEKGVKKETGVPGSILNSSVTRFLRGITQENVTLRLPTRFTFHNLYIT